MTSHDVVSRGRRLAHTRRVGHAGTLDPMATGVLILGVNQGTRLLTYLVGCDKTYEATIRLGVATVTDDAEGETTVRTDATLEMAAIESALGPLRGQIDQVPSAVSAIKIDGKRSYARVRAGEDVELAARPVTIERFEVRAVRQASADGRPCTDVEVLVSCSSGTYVRALARDLGASLGVGGHLTALVRTRVGPIEIAEASDLETLFELQARGDEVPLTPLDEVARRLLTCRDVDRGDAELLANGRRIAASGTEAPVAAIGPDANDGHVRLLAILSDVGPAARPKLVFPES